MKYVTMILVALSLAGCVSSGTKVTNEQAQAFKKGETTKEDVIKALGEPNTVTNAADGTVTLAYVHMSAAATPATYIPYVGLLAGGATGSTNTVALVFDKNGKLSSYSSTSSNVETNTGLLNQK